MLWKKVRTAAHLGNDFSFTCTYCGNAVFASDERCGVAEDREIQGPDGQQVRKLPWEGIPQAEPTENSGSDASEEEMELAEGVVAATRF